MKNVLSYGTPVRIKDTSDLTLDDKYAVITGIAREYTDCVYYILELRSNSLMCGYKSFILSDACIEVV